MERSTLLQVQEVSPVIILYRNETSPVREGYSSAWREAHYCRCRKRRKLAYKPGSVGQGEIIPPTR